MKCKFQRALKNDIASVKNENRLFVKADKSTNFYKLDAHKYNRLLNDNVTKTYRKADTKQISDINDEARCISTALHIDDRVESLAMNDAFITLKGHKDNFANRPTCRLSKTFRNPSTNDCLKLQSMKLHLTNQHLFIRKL